MWTCKNCHEEIESTFDICWNCGYDKDGNPPENLDSSDSDVNAIPTDVNAIPVVTKSNKRVPGRYDDAYSIAHQAIGLGALIKLAGILGGVMALIIPLMIFRDTIGLVIGVFAGGLIYLFLHSTGVFISSQGQFLLASLDTAAGVNEIKEMIKKQTHFKDKHN